MSSQIKTALLLGLLTALILIVGQALGGRGGLVIAFFLAVIMATSRLCVAARKTSMPHPGCCTKMAKKNRGPKAPVDASSLPQPI